MSIGQTRNRESGMVLVVVLWTVASMALLVSAFNSSVRGSASVLASEIASAQRQAALSAGLEIAVARLLAEDEAEPWRPNGDEHSIRFGVHRLTVSIRDANGLIDINKADGELLLGLLNQFAESKREAEQIRDRILDWRDPDDKARFRGAEDIQYQSAGLPRGAGDTNFVDVTQLRDVLEIPPALFRRILPFLTVHSSDGRVNPEAAPREVLASVPGFLHAGFEPADRRDQDKTEQGFSRPSAVTGTSKWISREAGRALIIRVAAQGNGATGPILQSTIMLAADKEAPYRVLSWGMVGVSHGPLGGPS